MIPRYARLGGQLALVALLSVLVLMPVAAALLGAFRTASPLNPAAEWSTLGVSGFLSRVLTGPTLWNTLIFTLSSTLGAVIVGGWFAALAERSDSRSARLIDPIMGLSMFIFPMIVAMGYSLLTHPTLGAINQTWRLLGGQPGAILVDSTGWGVLLAVQILTASNPAYFLARGSFRRYDPALEEASLVAGRSGWQTFLRVTLPLLTPVFSGILLVSAIVLLQAFIVPYILRSQPTLLLTEVVKLIAAREPPDYPGASAVGLVVIAATLLLAGLQWLHSRGRRFEAVGARASPPRVIRLGRWRALAGATVWLYLLLAVLVPLAAVVVSSFTLYPGVYSEFTLGAYHRLFADRALGPALRNSLLLALAAGALASLLALVLAVLRRRSREGWFVAALGLLVLAALALPSVIQAVGMLWSYPFVPGLRRLYGTNWMVLIGLVVVVVPLVQPVLGGALAQISGDLEDAAVVAGVSRFRAFLTVTLRLLLPSLLSVWFLATVFAFANVEIPMLLGAPGGNTITQMIATAFTSLDRSYASALTSLLLASLIALGLALLALRGLAARLGGPHFRKAPR